MKKGINKLQVSLLIVLCSTLFFAASKHKLPVADDLADAYFESSIKAATIAYATTRGVNAVVSVVKESELDLSPAGVGFTIAAGQILDPIDDMTERLSSLLVAAITSLGIQKIGYEISALLSFKAIALLLLFCIPLLWFYNTFTVFLLELALKTSVILLLLRFMLPTSALISESLYDHWLHPNIETSLVKLAIISDSYENMSQLPGKESHGFFLSLTTDASDKIEKTKQTFLNMVTNVEQIISSLLSLTTAYLAIFIVQVVILPALMLWLLLVIAKSRLLEHGVNSISLKLKPIQDNNQHRMHQSY